MSFRTLVSRVFHHQAARPRIIAPLPHNPSLAELYAAYEEADEILNTRPAGEDGTFEARGEMLSLADQLAEANPTLALKALKHTASSAHLWGEDGNEALARQAMRISTRLRATRPSIALRFADAGVSLSKPESPLAHDATHVVAELLPLVAATEPEIARQTGEHVLQQQMSFEDRRATQTAFSRLPATARPQQMG